MISIIGTYSGVARISGMGVLEHAHAQNLNYAHLWTGKVEVQTVTEKRFEGSYMS
jgi:hypothetical protein